MVLECAVAASCVCLKSASLLSSCTLGSGVVICRLHAFVRKLQCVVHRGFAAEKLCRHVLQHACNRITCAHITITPIVAIWRHSRLGNASQLHWVAPFLPGSTAYAQQPWKFIIFRRVLRSLSNVCVKCSSLESRVAILNLSKWLPIKCIHAIYIYFDKSLPIAFLFHFVLLSLTLFLLKSYCLFPLWRVNNRIDEF